MIIIQNIATEAWDVSSEFCVARARDDGQLSVVVERLGRVIKLGNMFMALPMIKHPIPGCVDMVGEPVQVLFNTLEDAAAVLA